MTKLTTEITIEELQYRINAHENDLTQMWTADYFLNVQKELLALKQAAKNPVGYRNKFTGHFFTLEQQPDAATDTAVYEPVFLAAPVLPKQPELVENLKKVMNSWLAMEPKLAFQPEFTDVMMLLDGEPAPAQPVIPEQPQRISDDDLIAVPRSVLACAGYAYGKAGLKDGNAYAQLRSYFFAPAITAQPVIPEQPEFYTKPDRFLPECLKPEEISGERRNSRIAELMGWFDRYYSGKANPKWLKPHVAELCYYILTVPQLSAQPVSEPYKSAANDVIAERQRQISEEG